MARLAVLGAGAWGTVLASLLAKNNHDIHLWTRRESHAATLQNSRQNPNYVRDLVLPNTITVTANLEEACQGVIAALVVVPSKGLRETLEKLPDVPALLSCCKGLEITSFKRLSEVIREYKPNATVAALSGPNLALEIAAGKPAAATLASEDLTFAKTAQGWLNQSNFRVYSSDDLIGVEIAGALKNVIALAAGICDGLKLGDNAKASLITRGLNEIIKVGTHLGGDSKTFYGLSGLGDLVATCSSGHSRNHTAGERLAKGATLQDLQVSGLTAEGIPTTKAVHELALNEGLELPICSEIYRVVYENKKPFEAISNLMGRTLKAEG
ncbi:MAG: NAD(P)H-dependent glycerol-3-phosphate dehydrogenase [Trueperaceae bacterium]